MKTKTKQSDIHILELSKYEKPEIKEEANKDFVSLGEDNNYYQDVIDRFVGSTTNHSAINGIVNQIYGKGLGALNASQKPDEYAQMMSIFKPKDVRCVIQDLKILGEGAFQLTYKGDKIVKATHFPRQTLRAEKCNDKGEIEAYLYHHNWTEYKTSDKLTRIPVFGKGNKKNELFIVRKYVTGFHYYSLPDYCAALPYALLEELIATYQINDCENGFSGTSIINFANGIPDKEKRENIKSNVLNKLTGANGDKVIVSFNPDKDSATTVEQIALNDAPQHYEYLSRECTSKIMLGHRITSPLLLGLRDGNGGLGSNSDEIETASLLFDNVTIKPYQNLMIEALDDILAVNDIALKLYFKTIQPLEFIDTTNAITKEQKEEETGLELSDERPELLDDEADLLLEHLKGEEITDEWELVDAREYSEDNSDTETWANELIEPKKSLLQKLATVVTKKGKGDFSVLDKSYYKVRYRYAERHSSANSRKFCKAMMARNQVYRIEDIDYASKKGVNKKFGHNGKSYDIFRFKGGKHCGHYFEEVLFRLKKKTNGKYIEKTDKMKDYVEVDSIPKSYQGRPRGWRDAIKAPKDMPNGGAYPS